MRSLPFFERPPLDRRALEGYRHERLNQLTLPTALALMEGGFVGVIADKVYHVHPAVLAVTAAAPMLGNVSSFAWARWARGRRKVPLVTALQAAITAGVAAVALAPAGTAGALVLVGALLLVRVLMVGELTARSTIWSLNYPRHVRARYTGRLQLVMTGTMAVTSLAASWMLERDPQSFRIAYAVAAIVSIAGVAAFARVPHLGEQEQLALERSEPARRTRSVRSILRADPLFARYQACQFTLGAANMMIEGSIVYLVSRQMQASYVESIAVTVAIPMVFTLAATPLWAAYIDRVHITRFRSAQSGFWIAYGALQWLGAWQESLWVLALGRVIYGIARAGSSLAWQLGHNDFSSPRDLAAYMGAHVTLTGVRGAFAPFAGILLFAGWSEIGLRGSSVALPGFSGIQHQTYGLCTILMLLSAIGFARLERAMAGPR